MILGSHASKGFKGLHVVAKFCFQRLMTETSRQNIPAVSLRQRPRNISQLHYDGRAHLKQLKVLTILMQTHDT